ncbi:hypothetical protein FB563_0656 [Streptomyces puniciscabiei]|uniref:Uncharacterized protein n=1 Tax=Streptomyces puniciscabiei TaxID=164348 RepID=A0A542U9J7_9ACTN|nr:hypothetical protein [Streptomyces puniciscabiei]TQK95737.1 hypothetical protein FB563_0656 [Streptomyces puniciscabiei]
MRRVGTAVLLAVALGATLTATPARADGARSPGIANCTTTACHFDVPPGTYDVTVRLGGATASGTSITGETRRSLLPETAVPIVRRWFNADGTLDNGTALLVNSLGVDLPAVIRSAAAEDAPLIDLTAETKALVESLGPEGSKAIYLYNEKRDNTHTSVHGATVYAGLVRDGLLARHLVPGGAVRVG